MRFINRLVISLFLFIPSVTMAQHSEIGILGGTAYYLGELNPGMQVSNKINPAVGVFFRKNTSKRYALRFGANYAKIGASDQITSTTWSNFRQLSFSSSLLEAYGILEFNFLPYQINNYTTNSYTPYVFIGIAGFMVSPEVQNEGVLSTTAGGSFIAPSIPFGLGLKFNLSGNMGMAIEWGMRKTYTDEIDGLSESYLGGYQLSNSQNNDWYSILGITLNYKILTESDHCPGVIN
ncbi:MAG: hypothetical protein KDD41_12080 [Flavobacteriales bacterium]|nr:hypothetical protein [Flavobacteriales bacterium]